MVYSRMKIFTKDEVGQMEGFGLSDQMLFRTPKSMKHFVGRAFRHTISAQPIRYGLQVITLIAAIVWGVFTGHWTPFFIFMVLTIILRGLLLFSYARLYRVMHDGSCHYRIDKYGISLVVECKDGEFMRSITDSWSLVRSIYVYPDFIVIKMEKASVGADEYFLFPDDINTARNNILGFWQRSINGITPEELPNLYTSGEMNEVTNFIESRFGKIECIGHETVSTNIHIDLAIIKPTFERPYYTICTIGAGAFRMDVPDEDRLKHGVSEYNEYVIYLPEKWNVTDEGLEKEENWWPLRMLKSCAYDIIDMDGYFCYNDLYAFNDTFDESTSVCAAYFDYPLPDPAFETKVHLASTGSSVNFLQVIPCNKEEVDYFDKQTSYSDRYQQFFGIDIEAMEDVTEEERKQIFEHKILQHFSKMIKNTH